ncbi:MAG: hypothetical protein V7609_2095 [Verrucomicrobiota bacterium]
MPDPIPQSQKGQLDAFFAALGVSDFTAAMSAITQFKSVENWQTDQQALFNALGVTDQAGAISAIGTLKTQPVPVANNADRDAMFAALGVTDQAAALSAIAGFQATATHYQGLLAILEVKDQSAAIVAIGRMSTTDKDHAALVKALGATDHATALTAATNIEATVTQRVKQQAASAGLPEPAPKGPAVVEQPGGGEKAVTPRSRLAANINTQIEK